MNISESDRIRRQLAAEQDRFRTVLDALDTSVSVAPIGSVELLFANRRYREWFGRTTEGHLALLVQGGTPQTQPSDESRDAVDSFAGLPMEGFTRSAPAEHVEVFVERLDKWLEISSRYLAWVDGRLVQMVIASDVTARHVAEERAIAEADHAQAVGRLVTMGEMASSVAHELNQPLAAISNYCAGILSRSESDRLGRAELESAVQKIARQAERAAQVVQHIRAFVKRSEPQRELIEVEHMVDQVSEVAEINLRRRQIAFVHQTEADLPCLYVDPILIEQTLINLIRNGADAVEAAQRAEGERRVALCVRARGAAPASAVEFRVTDSGDGFSVDAPAQLFEAFFSTKRDGMGMGLNLCRSIVEAHRGRISAENLYNEGVVVGCRFTFWIPVSARAVRSSDNPISSNPEVIA